MNFNEQKLQGVFEITPSPHFDSRGFFMRAYDNQIFEELNIHRNWVQENHSRSEIKGIIRGLHFQFPPCAETKLIRCIRGTIFDVFVDLRIESPTFGKWQGIELSEHNKKMVYIPRGFAHGFSTLTEVSEVVYKVDSPYSPDYEAGIMWNDPDLNIDWKIPNPFLSEKDQNNMTLKEFVNQHQAILI